jgi:cytoskeletal protein CcmA (bactofilin family)
MAMQSPFFGKSRESEPLNHRTGLPHGQSPAQALAAGATAAAAAQPATSTSAAAGLASPAAPVSASSLNPVAAPEGGSKLTVGPNIKLKGLEITDCDTLVVEGTVEATMDSRVIEIAERGAFKGSAEIDIAEIRGAFDGNLTVRQRLVIHASGRVTGKIRYGKLVIEEGGQLAGEIECAAAQAPRLTALARPGIQAAA